MNKLKITIEVFDGGVTTNVTGNKMPYNMLTTTPHSPEGVVEVAPGIQLDFDKILKPSLTVEQQKVFMGLLALGYKYLACNNNGCLYAYNTYPHKNESNNTWDHNDCAMRIRTLTNVIDNFCSWEDEEPTSIEWLLGKKDKNE